jgi:restriction system protein
MGRWIVTIPDYQTVMLPLLNLAADGEEHSLRDAIEELADHFHLSEEESKQLLPSGAQATFDNRVGWARTYMKKAGLLQSPRRGYFKITDVPSSPNAITLSFLMSNGRLSAWSMSMTTGNPKE